MKKDEFCISEKDTILKKNEIRKTVSKTIIQQAKKILKKGVPDTDYNLFRRYHITGQRSDYQKPFLEKRKNLILLAMAYHLSEDGKFLLKLQDYIWDICNEPLWSAPAHLPEKINFSNNYIDLVASDTAAKLAEIIALFGEKLEENIKSRVLYELEKRIFVPFYQHPEDYWWYKSYYSNWCAVCCGNIGVATILAGRNGIYFEKITDYVIDSINRYFDNFDDAGGWVEGISYWNYGITNALRFVDILYRATDGKINLYNHPKIQMAGMFPVHCFLPPEGFINFGDGYSGVLLNREAMLLLGHHTKSGKYISWLLRHINLRDFEQISTLRKFEVPKPEVPQETFVHFKEIGWVITRKNWKDKNGPVLAIKAGNNGEPHNQVDVGQFIFHVFGEDYLCDHGAGEYTKDYFSPKRYENPFCNDEGHSLIFIDGKSQGIGIEFSGNIIEASSSLYQDIVSVDMTGAYPDGLATKIIRTLKFLKKSKYGKLLIEDLVEPTGTKTIETRLQFNGTLKRTNKTGFIITGKNGKVALNVLEPSGYSFSIGSYKNLRTLHETTIDIKFLSIVSKSNNPVRFLIEVVPIP